MKKFILYPSALILALLCGCSMIRVESVDCRATYTRFWFEQEGFKAKICGGEASVAKTTNNTELLEQLLPLVTRPTGAK